MFSRQITQEPTHDTLAIADDLHSLCFRQGATIRATCCGGFETFGCFGFAHLSSREPGKPLNGFAGLCDLFFSCKHRSFLHGNVGLAFFCIRLCCFFCYVLVGIDATSNLKISSCRLLQF